MEESQNYIENNLKENLDRMESLISKSEKKDIMLSNNLLLEAIARGLCVGLEREYINLRDKRIQKEKEIAEKQRELEDATEGEYIELSDLKKKLNKEKMKKYLKKYHKEYRQRPDVKKRERLRMKKYHRRPEIKEKTKNYNKEYYRNHREQFREYQRRRREKK